jgi:hypothetical protein
MARRSSRTERRELLLQWRLLWGVGCCLCRPLNGVDFGGETANRRESVIKRLLDQGGVGLPLVRFRILHEWQGGSCAQEILVSAIISENGGTVCLASATWVSGAQEFLVLKVVLAILRE